MTQLEYVCRLVRFFNVLATKESLDLRLDRVLGATIHKVQVHPRPPHRPLPWVTVCRQLWTSRWSVAPRQPRPPPLPTLHDNDEISLKFILKCSLDKYSFRPQQSKQYIGRIVLASHRVCLNLTNYMDNYQPRTMGCIVNQLTVTKKYWAQ